MSEDRKGANKSTFWDWWSGEDYSQSTIPFRDEPSHVLNNTLLVFHANSHFSIKISLRMERIFHWSTSYSDTL